MAYKFVEWDNKYSVGIQEIDNQHRQLINITNDLFDACTKGKEEANQKFRETIKEAVEYVKIHFNTEEEILLKNNYPGFNAHKKEHEEFIKNILKEVENFEKGKLFVPNHFVRFLREWLLEHIAIEDKGYEAYFRTHK